MEKPDFLWQFVFRVGGVSCSRFVSVPGTRAARADATVSRGVPYGVRVRVSSPGGCDGTPLRPTGLTCGVLVWGWLAFGLRDGGGAAVTYRNAGAWATTTARRVAPSLLVVWLRL